MKNPQEKIRTRDKRIYKNYLDKLLFNGKPPSLADIAKEENISRERARFYVERLQKEGYLIRLKHRKNQKVLLPCSWFQRSDY
jgi:DNA-binding Lrp family transcriptional regulator